MEKPSCWTFVFHYKANLSRMQQAKRCLTNDRCSAKISDMQKKVLRKRSTRQAPSERGIHRLKDHLGERERKVAFELNC